MKRWGQIGAGLVSATLVVAALMSYRLAQAQSSTLPSTTLCPSGLMIGNGPYTIATNIVNVYLLVPTTTTASTSLTVNKVVFTLNGNPIGQGIQQPTVGSNWYMRWASQLGNQGNLNLGAHVTYNGTQTCMTPPVPVIVQNTITSQSAFMLQAFPQQWRGLTSTAIDINAQLSLSGGELTPTELAQFSYIEWSTDIGSLVPNRTVARFSSGSAAGNGAVRIRANYSGQIAQFDVPIIVDSQLAPPTSNSGPPPPPPTDPTNPTPLPYPTSTSSGPSSTATTDPFDAEEELRPLTQEEKVALISTQLDSQPVLLSCANLNLTPARIDTLRRQADRLDAEEFAKITGCFAETNFIVPSAYAPIAPEDVRSGTNIQESQDTRINDATTDISSSSSTGVATPKLRFQGQAKPNSDVLLYVFSEPLVLYAKADNKGNWVYDLVDPLAPGKHEAYAVVETETGTYKKSSPFSFLIKTAQASAENPTGYSLSVKTVSSLAATPSKQRSNLYALGAMSLVIVVTLLGLMLVFRTLKHVPAEPTEPIDTPNNEG